MGCLRTRSVDSVEGVREGESLADCEEVFGLIMDVGGTNESPPLLNRVLTLEDQGANWTAVRVEAQSWEVRRVLTW